MSDAEIEKLKTENKKRISGNAKPWATWFAAVSAIAAAFSALFSYLTILETNENVNFARLSTIIEPIAGRISTVNLARHRLIKNATLASPKYMQDAHKSETVPKWENGKDVIVEKIREIIAPDVDLIFSPYVNLAACIDADACDRSLLARMQTFCSLVPKHVETLNGTIERLPDLPDMDGYLKSVESVNNHCNN